MDCIGRFCNNIDRLEIFMKDHLSPSRYTHSVGVERMALILAEVHGADVCKARFAGRYHDIAKCFGVQTMNDYVIRYGLPQRYINDAALAHSKVGAAILSREFGVDDTDILNAVSSHTTGRANMSLLEEIIYVSDAIEESRDYPEISDLRRQAVSDLDETCLFIMDYTIDLIMRRARVPDSDTLEAREFILNKQHTTKRRTEGV